MCCVFVSTMACTWPPFGGAECSCNYTGCPPLESLPLYDSVTLQPNETLYVDGCDANVTYLNVSGSSGSSANLGFPWATCGSAGQWAAVDNPDVNSTTAASSAS